MQESTCVSKLARDHGYEGRRTHYKQWRARLYSWQQTQPTMIKRSPIRSGAHARTHALPCLASNEPQLEPWREDGTQETETNTEKHRDQREQWSKANHSPTSGGQKQIIIIIIIDLSRAFGKIRRFVLNNVGSVKRCAPAGRVE